MADAPGGAESDCPPCDNRAISSSVWITALHQRIAFAAADELHAPSSLQHWLLRGVRRAPSPRYEADNEAASARRAHRSNDNSLMSFAFAAYYGGRRESHRRIHATVRTGASAGRRRSTRHMFSCSEAQPSPDNLLLAPMIRGPNLPTNHFMSCGRQWFQFDSLFSICVKAKREELQSETYRRCTETMSRHSFSQ